MATPWGARLSPSNARVKGRGQECPRHTRYDVFYFACKTSHHKILSPGMMHHNRRRALLRLQKPGQTHANVLFRMKQGLFRWVVVQVLPEPSLDLCHANPFAFAVVGDLITIDLAEAEIS